MNREEWLINSVKALEEVFFDGNGYTLPNRIMVSCGFPRGHAKAIGQCWDPKVTKDGTIHIFICPTQGDGMRVLDIMLHELIHAAVGLKEGHRGKFKKLALEFGLEGKMTATHVVPGSELHRKLAAILTQLGDYPHATILTKDRPRLGPSPSDGDGDGEGEEPKGRTKWVVYVSTKEPEFRVTMSPFVIKEFGVPLDPWGEKMVDRDAPKEEPGDDDDDGSADEE